MGKGEMKNETTLSRKKALIAAIVAAMSATVTSAFVTPHSGMTSCRAMNGWGVVPSRLDVQESRISGSMWRATLRMSDASNTASQSENRTRPGSGAGRGGRGGRGDGNSNFNQRRGPPGGRGRSGGPTGGRGGRGGQGAGRPTQGATLRLENPMKMQKIKVELPPRPSPGRGGQPGDAQGRRNGQQQGNGRTSPGGVSADKAKRGRSPTPGGPSNAGDAAKGGGDDGPSSIEKGPKRDFTGGKKTKKDEKDYDKKPKTALRLGTGKKGRAAERASSRGSLRKRDKSREMERKAVRALERRTVELPDGPLTVSQLAEVMDEKPVAVIKYLMTDFGVMATMTQNLDPSTCVAVVEGFGKVVAGSEYDDNEDEDSDEEDDEESALDIGYALEEDDPESLVSRPPVVTIMGHVDHGKTSLLDAIRNTRVTAGEAGGITQHIGAYQVMHKEQLITFIDTPGHAAFTDMRQRGANITDIVILMVAADDGVKQQTADSIACARQAGVPLVVAINKIDLKTADVARVKADLTGYNVLTEDLGGDILCSEISAKQNINLDDLLEKVLLQAEVQDLKANPNRNAQGVIIEARVEKGFGTVATTLIQKGTIKIGDIFVAGTTSGRVRALIGTDGKTKYEEAGPSTPISVVGFDGVPAAGDTLVVCHDEQTARDLAANRNRLQREKDSAAYQAGLMKSVAATFAGGKIKEVREMCVVVKADVQGSAEALSRSLSALKLENDEAIVTVKVLVSEAGEVTKSDIAIASVTPDTTVLAFGCGAHFAATEDARKLGVPIEYFSIVYDAIDSVESRMQEVLSPTPEGEYVGSALVQEVFNIGGLGNIAGSKCRDGIIKKGSNVRVMRGDKILAESKVKSLRNFKSEVDSITTGDECGVGLTDYEDFSPGDVIESYVEAKK